MLVRLGSFCVARPCSLSMVAISLHLNFLLTMKTPQSLVLSRWELTVVTVIRMTVLLFCSDLQTVEKMLLHLLQKETLVRAQKIWPSLGVGMSTISSMKLKGCNSFETDDTLSNVRNQTFNIGHSGVDVDKV